MTGKSPHLSGRKKNSTVLSGCLCLVILAVCSSPGRNTEKDILFLSRQADIRLTGALPDTAVAADSLEALCGLIRRETAGARTAPDTVAALNRALFDMWGLVAAPGSDRPEHLVLTRILREKRAACLGGVALVRICGRRLGLPLVPVILPGHVFIRYQTPDTSINIEMLRRGLRRSDGFYREYYRVPDDHPVYMRPVDDTELAGLFHYNLANIYRSRGRYEDAVRHYRACLRRFPVFSEAYDNLAGVYGLTGDGTEADRVRAAKPGSAP